MSEITQLLEQARAGSPDAAKALFVGLYDEMKRLARRQLQSGNAPLQATSLVHEAYCKIALGSALAVNDRQHFFAVAARVMRQIVLDAVRARNSLRRGGDVRVLPLDTQLLKAAVGVEKDEEVLALDDALQTLESCDPDLAKLVELRFYAGLELSEIRALNGRSESSLKRDWRRARAFLLAEMGKGGSVSASATPTT